MAQKNFYTVSPGELEPGDVLLCITKLLVTKEGHFRLYRCDYEGPTPEGSRVYTNETEVQQSLFPVASNLKLDR